MPIGYGRGRGYNLVPDFTKEEVTKFVQTSKLIADKGLDNAIKEVWGDLNAQLEQEREGYNQELECSLDYLSRRVESLENRSKQLLNDNAKLRKSVAKLENRLSSLIGKLSKNKKLKKLLE